MPSSQPVKAYEPIFSKRNGAGLARTSDDSADTNLGGKISTIRRGVEPENPVNSTSRPDQATRLLTAFPLHLGHTRRQSNLAQLGQVSMDGRQSEEAGYQYT